MKRPALLLLVILPWFAPVSGQADGVKMGFFQSPANWYGQSFLGMAKARGATQIVPGNGFHVAHAAALEPKWQTEHLTVLNPAFASSAYRSSGVPKTFAEVRQAHRMATKVDFVSWMSAPSAKGFKLGPKHSLPVTRYTGLNFLPYLTSESMAKYYEQDDVVVPDYGLQPICCTPPPPCCPAPCPCPCPCPCPIPWLSGDTHILKPWLGKTLPYGVKLTLNAEKLGPIVDDAMRKLATKYRGFKDEYIASGPVKLEPQPMTQPRK